jgi:hypothetical protein
VDYGYGTSLKLVPSSEKCNKKGIGNKLKTKATSAIGTVLHLFGSIG